jgi:hypothetical protein
MAKVSATRPPTIAMVLSTTSIGEYNTRLAKLMQRLKKDAGASHIAQNYKGTGSQAYRRQLWIHFKSGAVVDVWLENGYAKIGGVVMNRAPGSQSTLAMGIRIPYGDSPEWTYRSLATILHDWANPSAGNARRSRRS